MLERCAPFGLGCAPSSTSWAGGVVVGCLVLFSPLAGAGTVQAQEAQGRVVAPPGTQLGLPFSAGILSEDFLFLSGAIGNKPGTIELVEGGAAAQVEQTFRNLGSVLEATGLGFDRVVSANAYLADPRHAGALVEVAGKHLTGPIPPAPATIVADVAIPGALVELSLLAARPGVEVAAVDPEGWPRMELSSWGVLAGDTLFTSGLPGIDLKAGTIPEGPKAQVEQALANLASVLGAAGMGADQVATCRVCLKDARHFASLNEAYRAFFSGLPPARATVRADLMHPDWLVEIQCVAVRGAERKEVHPEGWAKSRSPLVSAIEVGGRLYLSGMVGRGEDGWGDGVEAQTRITLERLQATLAAAGMGFRDVEMATVFLSDIRFYAAMNAVYAEVVGQPPPARATVGTQLMSPDALVEIQMVASKAGGGEAGNGKAGVGRR